MIAEAKILALEKNSFVGHEITGGGVRIALDLITLL